MSILSTLVTQTALSLLTGAILIGAAFCFRLRAMRRLEALIARLGHSRWAVVIAGVSAFAISAWVASFIHVPEPRIHDEFSYLLAADTFAHGRLTNPTHPFWRHFESLHILQRPSYASKYPPGQGLILAAGELLGDPAVGLWLSAGLACAALCWMLLAFVPARWAMLGGLLAGLHPLVIRWTQCYWGGLVAVAGGALVVGAAKRVADQWPIQEPRPLRAGDVAPLRNAVTDIDRRRGLAPGARRRMPFSVADQVRPSQAPTMRSGVADAVVLAGGIAILANSRPFEGAILTLLVLAGLAMELRGRSLPWRIAARTVALPCVAVLVAAALWMGYYNFRVTGNALRMPYVEHESQYWVAPVLMFEPMRPGPPPPMPESMRVIAIDWAVRGYRYQHTPSGFIDGSVQKLSMVVSAAVNLFDLSSDGLDPPNALPALVRAARPLLLIPLVGAVLLLRDRRVRRTLATLFVFLICLTMDTWMHPQYGAPAAGLLTLALVQGLRRIAVWRPRGRPVGRSLARLTVVAFALSLVAVCLQLRTSVWNSYGGTHREPIISFMNHYGKRHLVLVRYNPGFSPSAEWVYNDADIDASPIVWARELSPDEDRRLIAYFHDRMIWLLILDGQGGHLSPYPRGLHAVGIARHGGRQLNG